MPGTPMPRGLPSRRLAAADSAANAVTTYAVGDVHGRHDLLLEVITWVSQDCRERGTRGKLVFLGDYVDRGPASRQVVETLLAGSRNPEVEFLCLRGNHDDMFAKVCRDLNHPEGPTWFRYGGQQTLESYGGGIDTLEDLDVLVPETHVRFLESLPLFYEDAKRIFVHAGVMPGVPLGEQTSKDLMWVREPFLSQPHGLGKVVVHAHTPRDERTEVPEVLPHRINLDTKAYWTGVLTCAAFDPGYREPRFFQTGAPALAMNP